MTTSAPSIASSIRVVTRAPVRSISGGRRVRGPASVTSAPIFGRSAEVRAGDAAVADVAADRDAEPLELPLRPAHREGVEERLRRVLVRPVAGVDDRARQAAGRGSGARRSAWCRMTMASGAIASRFLAVSRRVSPFETDEPAAAKAIESAERRRSAISNEKRVRVEFSKKRFATSFPRSVGTFLIVALVDLAHRLGRVEDRAGCRPRRSTRCRGGPSS